MKEAKHKSQKNSVKSTSSVLTSAKGPVTIPLTNDYLFRALLQKNNHVLKGLICSLLHLSSSDVSSVEITNPIELGTSIDDKTFFLDIELILNNQTIINLEMQVINEHNWPDHPEFFATYKFLNVKNHSLYSDKIQLSVLDLTCIHLATDEDKFYQIDYWASLFKATTWEEIKMLASKNKYIQEASETIYKLSLKEKIRLQCEAREDYYRRQKSLQLQREQQIAEIEKQNSEIERQAAIIKQKESAYNDLLTWAKAHGYKT